MRWHRHDALCAAVTAALMSIGSAQAATTAIAVSGQAAPNGGTLVDLGTPQLNAAGQVLFAAYGIAPAGDAGLFLASGGALTGIVRSFAGQPFEIDPGTLNDGGQSTFLVVDAISGTRAFYASGSGNTLLARTGGSAPGGGTFLEIGVPSISKAGNTAFRASLANAPGSQGVFVSRGAGNPELVARAGDAAPGGGNFTQFESPVLTPGGHYVFAASQTNPAGGSGLYASYGGALTVVARQGDGAPGGGTFGFLGPGTGPTMNSQGQIAFLAPNTATVGGSGIYLAGGGGIASIARTGDLAPGGGNFAYVGTPSLNESGQVAFVAVHADSPAIDRIYRSSGGALTTIVRTGDVVPGGNGTFFQPEDARLIASGAVLFGSTLSGTTGGDADDFGLYLGDGTDTLEVMRSGRVLGGRIVSGLSTPWSPSLTGAAGVNDAGQVTYHASFTDGAQGNFLFTPELRWRRSFSGTWDTADHWTLGIAPGAVHDVKIDPAASIAVYGPSSDRTLRSLEVGGGTGTATLQLISGARLSAQGGQIQVLANGILGGDGILGTAVLNRGVVLAENLTFAGGLHNEGLVRGATALNPRINGNLVNLAAGQVRVGNGERLILRGTTHSNAGRIETIGGELDVTGALTNSGSINLREGIVRFNSGLTNANTGLVGVSFGTSDVFGTIVNQGSGPSNRGRIIVSGGANVTFYDAVTNNGELRVSAGANAVFFGLVNGIGAFTGTGTKFFEGGFSPGLSPAYVELDGPIVLGTSSTLTIELGGARRITEPFTVVNDGYDRVKVRGGLELLGGPLDVVLLDGFMPGAGQSYDVLDWDTLSGTFGSVTLPRLSAGLVWDTSHLYVDGTLSVAAVPEPHEYALMLAGLGMVAAVARRRRQERSRPAPDVRALRGVGEWS